MARTNPAVRFHWPDALPLGGAGRSRHRSRALASKRGDSLVRFGAKSFLPALIDISMLKESGPASLVSRERDAAGAGIGAELGSMKVTQQIDANWKHPRSIPTSIWRRPACLACTLMLPL